MPSQYVTPQGLQIPSVEQITKEIDDEIRADVDPLMNTDPDGPLGQVTKIVASHLREPWEVLQMAWNANNPDNAEGVLLKHVCAITGTKQAPATKSRFLGTRKLKVNLNSGTTLLVGRIVAVAGSNPEIQFTTTEQITADAGTGDYFVSAQCTVTGPVTANAGTVTVIVTAVTGWNSVTNPFDAEKGQNEDSDPQLRERRENELRATGTGTPDAMRADLLAFVAPDGTKPILDAFVFNNDTDVTDTNGLPPHSMEPLVFDGVAQDVADNDIAQIVWKNKPGGIKIVGDSSGTAKDARGADRTVAFSRPTLSEVVFLATLTLTNPAQLPSQYQDAVRAAIMAEFSKRVRPGSLIRVNHYERAALGIDGIEDCIVQVGFQTDGVQAIDTNLQLGPREMGYVQTSGITVA